MVSRWSYSVCKYIDIVYLVVDKLQLLVTSFFCNHVSRQVLSMSNENCQVSLCKGFLLKRCRIRFGEDVVLRFHASADSLKGEGPLWLHGLQIGRVDQYPTINQTGYSHGRAHRFGGVDFI